MAENHRYVTPDDLLESVTRLIGITIATHRAGPGDAAQLAEWIVLRLRQNRVEFIVTEPVRSGGIEAYP